MSKRIQKAKCKCCKKEVNITEEIALKNFERVGNIVFVYCNYCGSEIIISK